jgi:DNA-binding MarR family transcriptional regulator
MGQRPRCDVAEVLPRLAKRGLVSRETSSADRRVKLVQLTTEGCALVDRLQSAVARAHARLVAPLSVAARAQFLAQFEQLVETNNDYCVAPQRLPESLQGEVINGGVGSN